jgi:hypothetical protein
MVLNILPGKQIISIRKINCYLWLGTYHRQSESQIHLPDWTSGRWLTVGTSGINRNIVYINNTQLIIKTNDDQIITHDLKFTRVIHNKRQQENTIRIKAKSLEQW